MNKILEGFKKEVQFMENWTKELFLTLGKLPYEENDVRKDYFKVSYSNTYHYYISYLNILQSHLLNTKYFLLNKDIFKNFEVQVARLQNITNHPRHLEAHHNTLNQRVFVMAWSLFELCISTFYENVVTQEELEKQFNSEYLDVLKTVEVKEGKEEKFKKLLIKDSLHSIPIPKKYNYLLKIANGYGRDIGEDRAFLDFFGRFRNTVHSNFIFYGKDFTYRFGDAEFVFKNKKLVKWFDPFDEGNFAPPVKLYFYLIGNLNNIVMEIFRSVPKEGFIGYPDLDSY